MTWATRMHPFVLCGLLVASACGGSGDPNAEPRGIAVTVFMPSGPNSTVSDDFALTWALEYTVACGPGFDDTSSQGDAVTVEGAFEQAEAFNLGESGPTAVWKDSIEFPPGPCSIQLILRDADGEVLCSNTEPVTIEPETPTEAYFSLVCYATCPTIPLPGLETSPKTSCAPVGGVLLSAETPADLETVQSVHYVITQTSEGFLEGFVPPRYEGSLDFVGPGSVDLGAGPVATDIWEATVGVVDAGYPHILELTALDAEGEPICSAEKTVELIANSITQLHIILPCSN